jgi:stage II sporulation protein P
MMTSEENSGNMETQINDDTLQAENVAGLEQDENVTSEADVGEPQSISMDHASENDMDTMSADTELQPETEDSLADDTLEASSIGSSYLSDMLLTEQIRDFDYLLSNYYTVDADTTIDGTLLDADNLLTEDLTIQQNSDEPQILIYHTHSQEAFADSVEGDVSTTIVGMGEVLAELLRTKYGYQVIHDTGVYDLVDGVLDRSKAYDYARESVQEILEEHPTIEVVIDLHRDGVDGQKFVTEIDGKMTSMVMFFNGLSQDENGEPLTWLDNPYVADNLAFSLQLQLLARAQYPGYTRNIYLKAQRYNLHLLPRSLLVEAGTQLNTVEEEQNAMEPLADLLAQVLGNRS